MFTIVAAFRAEKNGGGGDSGGAGGPEL